MKLNVALFPFINEMKAGCMDDFYLEAFSLMNNDK